MKVIIVPHDSHALRGTNNVPCDAYCKKLNGAYLDFYSNDECMFIRAPISVRKLILQIASSTRLDLTSCSSTTSLGISKAAHGLNCQKLFLCVPTSWVISIEKIDRCRALIFRISRLVVYGQFHQEKAGSAILPTISNSTLDLMLPILPLSVEVSLERRLWMEFRTSLTVLWIVLPSTLLASMAISPRSMMLLRELLGLRCSSREIH